MSSGPSPGFPHAALIVDSDDTLRSQLVPLVHRSLAQAQPVRMVVGVPTAAVIREALGAVADQLTWDEPTMFSQRLGFVYDVFERYLTSLHSAGRRVHLIAEPQVISTLDPSTPVDRVGAYLPYEAVCSDIFARYGCDVTCVWDSRNHPTLVLEGVRAVHTHLVVDGERRPSPHHIPTLNYLAARNEIPLAPLPSQVEIDLVTTELPQLAPMRAILADWASGRQFADRATEEVVAAVSEVATNGLVHGAPPVRVRCWRRRDTLVVQVDDAGARPLPPTAGYRRPTPLPRVGGRGMWIARQLADVVTTHTTRSQTSVRLHFPYGVTHRHPPEWLSGLRLR